MMETQVFKRKFENSCTTKLTFPQGVRTHPTHLVWVRHCKSVFSSDSS